MFEFLGFEIYNLNKIIANQKYENKKEVIDFFEKIHNENLIKIENKNAALSLRQSPRAAGRGDNGTALLFKVRASRLGRVFNLKGGRRHIAGQTGDKNYK